MSTLNARIQHEKREVRVAELATRPVETARKLVQAEEALRQIEAAADKGIHDYGITQETPQKWMQLGDLVRNLLAPIRDAAREGMKR